MALSPQELVAAYRTMVLIRAFEERLGVEARTGPVRGLVHLCIGQEATAAGVCSALRPDDQIMTTHRGHGHMIAKGADVSRMMAEVFGKQTGYCQGRGGSMHIADFGIGVFGANGIVGGDIPIATGIALGNRLAGNDRVVAVFFGDGSSNEGAFHESLNLGSLWKLPIIYACENNQYGGSGPAAKTTSVANIADRAVGHNLPARIVDGNDVAAVHEATAEAAARARSGGGPTLLELKTYRWRNHMEGRTDVLDPFRDPAEIEAWKARCPVATLRRRLIADGVLTEAAAAAIEAEATARMDEAVAFANESPAPTAASATDYVFWP